MARKFPRDQPSIHIVTERFREGYQSSKWSKKIRERSSRSGVIFRRCRGICSRSRNSHPIQMFFGKEKPPAGVGIDEIQQRSVSQMEDGGLSERQESIVPIPNSDLMNIEQPTRNGTCRDQTFFASSGKEETLWERRKMKFFSLAQGQAAS